MKNYIFAPGIIIMLLFSLAGCSDQSQSPVSPSDQVLEKTTLHYANIMDWPVAPPEGGEIKMIPGGKIQFKAIKVTEAVVATDLNGDPDNIVSGQMEHYLSTMIDGETGDGPVHGSYTTIPIGGGDGAEWVGTYEGFRSYNGLTAVDIPDFLPYPDGVYHNWTLKLKLVGRGKGGLIDGWQSFSEHTLIIINFGNDPATPFPLPQFWFGTGSGFYKEH